MRLKNKDFLILLLFFMLLCLLPPIQADAANNQPTTFTFIHFTDPHFGSGVGNKNAPPVLADILQNYSNAAFLVNSGDMTETGAPQEYETYLNNLKPLSMTVYNTPGNHESRWVDAGKSYFKKYLGEPFRSWNYGGIHFITLDTTIAKGQNGHLEPSMLTWLKKDLSSVNKATPVVLFTHHPLFFDEGKTEANFTDNDWDLWPVIQGYNVRAIFTGHGHRNDVWQVNGLTVVMTKAAMESGYAAITVDQTKQQMTVIDRLVGQQETGIPAEQVLTTISLQKPSNQPAVKIITPVVKELQGDSLLLQADLNNWSESPQKVEYKLEDNGWKPLEPVNGHYQKEIDLTKLDDGYRTFWVRAVSTAGGNYLDKFTVKLNRNNMLKLGWEYTAPGGISSAPAIGVKYLYFGDNSGKITALDQNTGRKIWEYQTGGAVLGSVTYTNGNIYAGSADGKIYALKATTGAKLWVYQTQGAVIAQPLVTAGKVLVGSSDFHFYALNEKTGTKLWDFTTGSTIMMKAAYGDNTVFFGSWDNNFYAADIETGQEKWHQSMGSQVYYAPAASSPLYCQGKVYISTPGNRVVALDSITGQIRWEKDAQSGLSSPIVFNDAILYSTLGGALYALDPETGANVWQNDTSLSNFGASPVSYGGNLLIHSLTAKLAAYNTGNTTPDWSIRLGDTYTTADGTPGINKIYFGTLSGKVYTLTFQPGAKPAPFPALTAFADTGSHWARLDLNKLAKLNLMKGYADGTYRPAQPVTRAELAGVLSRYLKFEAPSPTFQNPFVDTGKHWASGAISAMAEKGIAGGYKDSKGKLYFKPDNNVKRAETMVMLARALGLTKPSPNFKTSFADIGNHWAKDAIMALEEKGLIGGYQENGKLLFKPENTMNRAEIGVVLVRVVNYKP